MSAVLRILEPGLLTTVQDLGRIGYQHLGVPTSGALDPVSLRAANILVGNAPIEGALEIAYVGPTFVVEADSVNLACAGANASIEVLEDEAAVRGVRYSSMQSFRAERGQVVRVGPTAGSSVVCLAVEGGFGLEPVLGSVSTYSAGILAVGKAARSLPAMPCRFAEASPAKGTSSGSRDSNRTAIPVPRRSRAAEHAVLGTIDQGLPGRRIHRRSRDASDGHAPRWPEARPHRRPRYCIGRNCAGFDSGARTRATDRPHGRPANDRRISQSRNHYFG